MADTPTASGGEKPVVSQSQSESQSQVVSQASAGTATDVTNPSAGKSDMEPGSSQSTASAGKSPKGKQKERTRHKNLDKDSLVCGVCTDKGSGFHFGAVTCESCKAFFRRWASKDIEPCNNNCKMDPFNRKFCPFCRLKKCVEIGMKKEWILDEEARSMRKKPVKKSPATTRKSGAQGASSSQVLEPPAPAQTAIQPLTEEQQDEINEIFRRHSALDRGKSEQNMEPSSMVDSKLYCADESEFDRLTNDPQNPTQLMNMLQGFITRFIPFMKSLRWYSQLRVDDRVNAFKSSIMEITAMRSAIQYDPDVGGFAVKNASSGESKNLQLEFIRHMFGDELYEAHIRFVTSFNTAARYDKRTMILTMLIKIFDSNNCDLADQEVMQQAQMHYSALLRSYLRSIYPEENDEKIFARLLMINRDVVDYRETCRKVIGPGLVASPSLEPLLRELFSD